MIPLEFLQRLAALVPRPRLHLIRFHGVLAPHAALRSQIVPGEADPAPTTANGDGEAPAASPRARMSWGQFLKRVFANDITACPQCGGTLTLRAAIEDPAVISKILTHLGLPSRAPPRAPARLDAFMQTAEFLPGFRFGPRTATPLYPIPQPTRHKGTPGWLDPRKIGRSDPPLG